MSGNVNCSYVSHFPFYWRTGGPYPAFGFLCSNPDNARHALRAQQMPVKVKMLRPEMVSRRISKKGKIGM